MEITLEGRVAIVTGGGSGLGLGYAQTLAESGAAVAVTGRRREPLEECVAKIGEGGGKALAVVCDQRSREEVEAAVKQVVDWKQKVDILVNNAGVYPPAIFLNIEEEQWLDVMDTNVNGPFRFSQVCARVMAAELGPMGITVNALTPGVSATEKFVEFYSDFGVQLMAKGLPLGRPCRRSSTGSRRSTSS